jgi:spermidine synthase
MPITSLVHYETDNPDLIQGYVVSSVLVDTTTPFQRVRIYNTPAFGRVLVLDDETQSAQSDEATYHESLVHPVMATTHAQHVLIIGGGEGATAREVLKYSEVESVTMVDIDADLMTLCRKHLPEWGANAWTDPRLRVIATDAFAWLETCGQQFDVIIMDLCDPDWTDADNQINRFYTHEFASMLRERYLTPTGAIVAQLGDYDAMGVAAENFLTAFGEEACHTYGTYIPSFASLWGFVVARKSLAYAGHLPLNLKYMTRGRLTALLVQDT